MALRVAFLALFTGLFIVAWSGDDAKLAAHPNPPQFQRQQKQPSPPEKSPEVAALPMEESSFAHPIPAFIPGGTYLVADRSGRTDVIFVARPDKSPDATHLVANDHFVVTEGANRWHFIRIEPSQVVSLRQ